MSILIGTLRFDPRRSYSGEALNSIFTRLHVTSGDMTALEGMPALQGVSLGIRVADESELKELYRKSETSYRGRDAASPDEQE